MKKILLSLLWLSLSFPLWANQRAQGFCQQGGQTVTTSGIASRTFVQASYPQCTVTVYVNSSAPVTSAVYSFGGSATGTAGQTCTVTFQPSTGLGTGTVILSGPNTIPNGATITVTSAGGYESPPTSAILSSGTATCSGTAVVSTTIGSPALATIYSDTQNTPQSNPFTANVFGYWFWYAVDGHYDVQLSGGGLAVPWTAADLLLNSTGGGGGGGGGNIVSLNGLTAPNQVFINDTNVQISSNGTQHTIVWNGLLSKGRSLSTVVYTDQANTYSAGLQDMGNVDLRIPVHASDPATCTPGQIEYSSSGLTFKICTSTNTWSGVSGSVTSVFGRTGAIAAQTGDYSASQVTNAVANNAGNLYVGGGLQDMASMDLKLPVHGTDPPACQAGQIEFNSSAAQGKICNVANTWTQFGAIVTSVFGRNGVVTAQSGDYAAAQVTNAVANNAANTYSGGGLQNFSAVDYLLPTHASDPATCTPGQIEYNSVGAIGKICTATNTWSTLATGGGTIGGGGTALSFAMFTAASTIGNTNMTQDTVTGQVSASKSINGPAASTGGTTGAITIDLSLCNRCEMGVLTGNVTSVAFTNKKNGLKFSISYTQATTPTGPFTVTYGASVITNTACGVSQNSAVLTTQDFEIHSDGTVEGKSCSTSDTPTLISGPTRAAPSTNPTSGNVDEWFDSTANMPQAHDAAGNLNTYVRTAASPATNQWVDYIQTTGVPHTSQPAFSNLSGAASVGQLPGAGVTTINTVSCTIGSSCTVSGGVNTQTTSYTLVAADVGKWVIMNCTAACTVTLYGTPTNGFYGAIESVGTTVATLSLNGKTYNLGTGVPPLNSFQPLFFASDGANYYGNASVVAGINCTLSPQAASLTINCSGGGGGGSGSGFTAPPVGVDPPFGTLPFVPVGTQACSSSASPAVCQNYLTGSVIIPTGTNPTLVVNTSSLSSNSRILLTADDTSAPSGATCNSTLATLVGGMAVTARTAGTSFTISYNGTISTNGLCVNYQIVN